MKPLLKLAASFSLLLPNFAHALVFYQSVEGGALKQITQGEFEKCAKIIYRESGKDQLSARFQKKALNALLTGEAVNRPSEAAQALKARPGACSYSEQDDLK
jgi:hypothetical protein